MFTGWSAIGARSQQRVIVMSGVVALALLLHGVGRELLTMVLAPPGAPVSGVGAWLSFNHRLAGGPSI
jgi:hypothetical protein